VVKSYVEHKGFGFVLLSSGDEALVNRVNLDPNVVLQQGDVVEFTLQGTNKGKKAMEVVVVSRSEVPHFEQSDLLPTSMLGGANMMDIGKVKSYNPVKGFGFIFTSEGDEALVQKACLVGMDSLQANEVVEFEVVKSDKGKRALNVRRPTQRFKPY